MSNQQFYGYTAIIFLSLMFGIYFLKGYKSLCNEFEALNASIQLESPKHTSKSQKRTIKEVLTAKVYAYNSEIGQTDENPNIMANGEAPGLFSVACPSRYKFGTKVEIDGITYWCEDRMAKRYREGNYFDIWKLTKDEAVSWGVRTLEVKILN